MALYKMVLKVEAVGGNMLSIYEPHDKKVKCQLYQPVYENEKVIAWIPSDKFCYCEEKGFQTTQTRENGRRFKATKGTLETKSLKKDEINIDWKIFFDGDLFIIDSMTQEDDETQQTYSTNGIVNTKLEVRR